MPQLNISRKIKIKATKEKVFQVIADLNLWSFWSPWLIVEPHAKSVVSEEGNFHQWEGKRLGKGEMRIVNKEKNHWVDYELNFIKPWKSHAKVGFKLSSDGEFTQVEWTMKSRLPFFLFWMKKMMLALINMDYDRGLKMLKEYVQSGKVNCKLTFKGIEQFKGFKYLGIKNTVSISDLEKSMANDMESLFAFFEHNKDLKGDTFFSIYKKWDIIRQKTTYIIGCSVKYEPKTALPNHAIVGHLQDGRVYTVSHLGDYQHLGNAWAAIISVQRAKEFKAHKKLPPFEIYVNNPQNTPKEGLITDVKMFVR